jgi:hypothetical protein
LGGGGSCGAHRIGLRGTNGWPHAQHHAVKQCPRPKRDGARRPGDCRQHSRRRTDSGGFRDRNIFHRNLLWRKSSPPLIEGIAGRERGGGQTNPPRVPPLGKPDEVANGTSRRRTGGSAFPGTRGFRPRSRPQVASPRFGQRLAEDLGEVLLLLGQRAGLILRGGPQRLLGRLMKGGGTHDQKTPSIEGLKGAEWHPGPAPGEQTTVFREG